MRPGAGSRLIARTDAWLTRPEPNAAGRAGLFRILFALFYLWHLAEHEIATVAGLRPEHRYFILLMRVFPVELPSWFYSGLESVLVFALVFLLAGLGTRWATAVVLVTGTIYEGFFVCTDIEHDTIFLAVWIPLFMLLTDRWGHTWSLDALRRRVRGITVSPHSSAWQYHLPARANLIILAVLFVNAAYFKVVGTWLGQPHFFRDLLLENNIDAAILGLPLNPLAPFVAQTEWAQALLLYGTIASEAAFIIVLFGNRLRNLVLSSVVIFHAVCAIWLTVTFTPILILYALYVDLQEGLDRLTGAMRFLHVRLRLPRPGLAVTIGATALTALSFAVLWNQSLTPRDLFTAHGRVNWSTIWYPILPLAIVWFIHSLLRLAGWGQEGEGKNVAALPEAS